MEQVLVDKQIDRLIRCLPVGNSYHDSTDDGWQNENGHMLAKKMPFGKAFYIYVIEWENQWVASAIDGIGDRQQLSLVREIDEMSHIEQGGYRHKYRHDASWPLRPLYEVE